ncbi:MAG: hypothetical protein VX617_05245 [Pseudomonadota bacterium]|nr:hypothetical protein [Pseudomonadota bacterium]
MKIICSGCQLGVVAVLSDRGSTNLHRKTSILTYPEKHIRVMKCPRCLGSGVEQTQNNSYQLAGVAG